MKKKGGRSKSRSNSRKKTVSSSGQKRKKFRQKAVVRALISTPEIQKTLALPSGFVPWIKRLENGLKEAEHNNRFDFLRPMPKIKLHSQVFLGEIVWATHEESIRFGNFPPDPKLVYEGRSLSRLPVSFSMLQTLKSDGLVSDQDINRFLLGPASKQTVGDYCRIRSAWYRHAYDELSKKDFFGDLPIDGQRDLLIAASRNEQSLLEVLSQNEKLPIQLDRYVSSIKNYSQWFD
ncbi:MAG: hypothetical protein J4215_02750 [Candidatus Diapherotrites archaeon]|uniref:Uncharacterized protein n=1 Tax=Candidatus Iainarchaeum sp. TaxID=3101447 RepID=A0A8T4L4J9_9ARCH|nr:hypothetical protein [Candidatus Diapherotrites archaeon]